MVLNLASRMLMQLRANTKKSKCLSHHFMLENNMIHQMGRGLYSLLPFGQRSVEKLSLLVDAELRRIGAQRVDLPLVSSKDLWETSGGWQTMGSELFRLEDRNHAVYCLQPTAEEAITKLVRDSINIPRVDAFPILLYQCNEKFRDESFPKFGLLRSRQFLMNDLYSFDCDESSANSTYDMVTKVYQHILYEILGLKSVRRVAADSDLLDGQISHEFHMPNQSCGDRILVCSRCGYTKSFTTESDSLEKTAITETAESFDLSETKQVFNSSCEHDFVVQNTVEVAHTFQLGTEFSAAFKAVTTNGEPYNMCCFGIGITRLFAACIDECSVSESAMRLPYAISPFKLAFILPREGANDSRWRFTWDTINQLENMPNLSNEIFVDDRMERSVGKRLVDANRLGIPHIFVSNSLKSDDPYGVPNFEYFRALIGGKSLQQEGRITHSDLFQLASSM